MDFIANALKSVSPFNADPNVTEQNDNNEKSIFSGLSERFNSKKLGGLESTVAEGEKQIANLEKEKDEFNRQLEDNIKKCTEEQDLIKKKIDKASKERDIIRGMLDRRGSYSETDNVTGERQPGGYQATDNSTDYGAAGATGYGATEAPPGYSEAPPGYSEAPPAYTEAPPGYTEANMTEQKADQAVANLAAAPVSDSSTNSPLTAGEIGGSEGLYPGLNKQEGGRRKSKRHSKRQKQLKTKRRRRRGYSRKRPKRTRGRARSLRKRGF